MAVGDLASVVDLRAGAILFVLAAAHFAVAAQMGAFRDYCSRVCRHRVSDRVVIFSAPIIARWVLPFGSLDSLAAGAALGWWGGRLRASRGGWLLALICLSMLTVAAVLRNSDPTKLKSVLVEPLEAGAFVILVARTATGFDGHIARFLSNAGLVFA